MRIEHGQATALESVHIVVNRLRARQDEIARAIYDRIREAVPDSAGARNPAYQEGVLTAVAAVLSYSLDAIEHGPNRTAPIPPEAAAQARRAARAGVRSGLVLRRYVAGHGRFGEFVMQETARDGVASDAPALLHISSTHGALLGHFTAAIEHEHDQERRRIANSPEQHRIELVCRLLDGETVEPNELAGLGYRFDAWHVAVIAVGASARAALESLKTDRQLLPIPHGDETIWAWLGAQRPLVQADIDRIRFDRRPADVSLAVGEPAQGIEGWRQSHKQAQQALQVALIEPQPRTCYVDIALLAPWLEDPDRGRAFIELYLAPLKGQNDGGIASRQTLRAYLEADRNASSAARALGVDRRTLIHRLDTIEQCIGYNFNTRKPELEVALRLHDLLKPREMHVTAQNPSLGCTTLV